MCALRERHESETKFHLINWLLINKFISWFGEEPPAVDLSFLYDDDDDVSVERWGPSVVLSYRAVNLQRHAATRSEPHIELL